MEDHKEEHKKRITDLKSGFKDNFHNAPFTNKGRDDRFNGMMKSMWEIINHLEYRIAQLENKQK
jgi:hypothetical protein